MNKKTAEDILKTSLSVGKITVNKKAALTGVNKSLKKRGYHGILIFEKKKKKPKRWLIVGSHLKGPKAAEVLLHESLHLAFPNLTEGVVLDTAKGMTRLLKQFKILK